jgi:hypothetical protein
VGQVENEGKPRTEWASLSTNLRILWISLACAVVLDLLGVVKGLGFSPSFQLQAQPFFFIGIIATVVLVHEGAKLGPILAGVIFWIPIIVLVIEFLLAHQIIPFGGDIVGIAELVVAIVGVIAAHNVFHKLKGGWIWTGALAFRKKPAPAESQTSV